MISQTLRLMTIAMLAFAVAALTTSDCLAQFDTVGGNLGGDTTGVGDIANTGTSDLGGTGGNAADLDLGGGSAGRTPDFGNLFGLDLEADIPVIEDRRRKGFVGPTSELGSASSEDVPPTGFIGPNADLFIEGGGGGNTGGNAGRGTGGQGQAAGEQNGFEVLRRGGVIRTRVRPAFQTRPIDGNLISTRFQQRMQNLPAMRSLGQDVRINVQNRTAVVSGFVQSNEEADRIVRQLRLEPGVYRIDNRMIIGN